MRLALYGATSTLLGVGIILSAFNQRANFYSALVYLAQSNACLMVLTNLLLLLSILFGHALQLIFYGPLRPIEIEHLYEKAWYAVTETCLAMTIFRDEFDVRFIVMFGVLLFVKCFGWIAGGRVEFMEQTPPANPILFHIRLASSLGLLLAASAAMLWHSVTSVLERGKPNMMVMFAFEFAILLITSLGISGRYVLSLVEKVILKREAARRNEARALERSTRRRQREERIADVERRRATGEEVEDAQQEEEEEEEDEVDVGGWEEKGTWVFYLELITDLLKLLTYLSFFSIVLKYYGLPLHIIRDLYLTLRSFITRIRDFIRYRRATAHMNSRYPDATAEEVSREGVCIICREEMRAWTPEVEGQVRGTQDQRSRPKKLPCGHVLHFACLRSWLERQQRCPTCRRPVLDESGNMQQGAQAQRPQGQRPAGVRAGGGGFALGAQIGPLGFDIGVGGPAFVQGLMDRMGQRPVEQPQQQPQVQVQQQGGHVPQPAPAAGVNQQPQVGEVQDVEAHVRATRERIQREIALLETTLRQLRHLQAGASQPIIPPANSTGTVYQALPRLDAGNSGLPQGMILPAGWSVIPFAPSGSINPPPPQPQPTAASTSASTTTGMNLSGAETLRSRRERRAYAESIRDHHMRMTPQLEKTFSDTELGGSSSRPRLERTVSAPTSRAATWRSNMEMSWSHIPSLNEPLKEDELTRREIETRNEVQRRIEALNRVSRVVADAVGTLRGLEGEEERRRRIREGIREQFEGEGELRLFGDGSVFSRESQEGVLRKLEEEVVEKEEEWKVKAGVVEGLLNAGGESSSSGGLSGESSGGKGKGKEVDVDVDGGN